jgi:hypothetical protein
MAYTIGTLNEQPLHAGLKAYYANGGGRLEARVGDYTIDVVIKDELIEVQTKNFHVIKKKLFELIRDYQVKLVYPVASEKWLVKLPNKESTQAQRRKSPKRGDPCQVFGELVSFPELIEYPNFTLDIVMVKIEEVRCYNGATRFRQNGWETIEKRLLQLVEIVTIKQPSDLLALIPETLPLIFTTSDLREKAQIPRWLAQKAAYCLKRAGAVRQGGKRGRYNLYEKI